MPRLEITYKISGGVMYTVCAYEILKGLKILREEFILLCKVYPTRSLGLCTARPNTWNRISREIRLIHPQEDAEFLLTDIFAYIKERRKGSEGSTDGSYWWPRMDREVRISFVSGLITELETFISEHNEKKV